ncbi:MAG: LPS assembly protein LptD [Gammaproteobacteria bacterium]|nr:LPS assembly protein LptD [Gammaproteobacteria bacterium]
MPKKHYLSFFSLSNTGLYRLRIKLALLFLLTVIASLLVQQAAIADVRDDCAAKYPSISSYKPPPFFSEDTRSNIDLSADKTLTAKDGSTTFDGDVVIERHELRITTDYAKFDNTQREVTVRGNVHLDTTAMSIDADSGRFFLDDRNVEFDNIRFFMPETRLRGHAETITSESDKSATLISSSITSCPPDDVDWLLSADSINLDLQDEYGRARGVVLRFHHIPFLYTPYIEFPVGDKRRSGLLVPSFGTSSSRGFELVVPWYWNIAPNQDATIAPHYMNRRGMQLDAQYRFLTQTTDGTFDVNYLPEDNVTLEERYSLKYLQHTKITDSVRAKIDYKDVSDPEYLQDFSSSLLGTSTTHLSQSADVVASYTNWQASALVQSYETLDLTIAESDRPYRMLPQIKLKGDEPLTDYLNVTLDSEWVNFVHEDDIKIEGPRFILQPGIEVPLQSSAWFLKPAVEFSHTQYNISDGSGMKVDTENRNLPITSIDSGIFLERTMSKDLIQTLEPRLFYLYVPFEDQSDLPLFDTSVPDFSLLQMFRKNRFYGGDRIGDANQITAALRSRIIDPATGYEYMRASIGQIYYFDDRRVTLTGIPATNKSSDIIGEISGRVRNWRANAGMQWDIEEHNSAKHNAALQYATEDNAIFNLGYSKRRETLINPEALEQTDISFVAPVSKKYTLIGRWNYSLEQERDLEAIAGFSYDSCCWSMIFAYQRNLVTSSSIEEDYDNSILFQLVLKGLGSVSGDSAVDKLKQSILGFRDEY